MMTKACFVTCGLPWCQNIKDEQTSLSRGLRLTAVALGIILAVGGTLILWASIPGLAQLGSAGGWSALVTGVVMITLGISIQCVKNKTSAELGAKQVEDAKKARKLEKKPSTLSEQALRAALSFECQRNRLPNVAPMLEKISTYMRDVPKEELIRISGRVTDQILNEWTTAVSKYLDARWAWPDASGRYSVIRQLITDPNLNVPLRDPTFILAIFRRSQLGNPIKLFELDVAEMLIAGFRDQHPALLECQPYNNAFFIEDINIVHDQAHEERLLKGYLMRKECSFMHVMQAIETAAQEVGISVVDCAAKSSHFDDRYGPKLWENGNIIACFRQLKQSIDSEKKFVVQGHRFADSYGQSVQGFLALCRILYPKNVILDANPNFNFVSSTDLAEKIANHPTVLLEYDICHLWYDILHLKAMFAGKSRTYTFKDGQFSMIDSVEKILVHIQKVGLKPGNAMTAQQLYLRLYALATLLN